MADTSKTPENLGNPRAGGVPGLLRSPGCRRGGQERGLAGGLRAWLEDAVAESAAAIDPSGAPLALDVRTVAGGPTRGSLTPPAVLGALGRALFRRIVITGTIGNPLADALDGLRCANPRDPALVAVRNLTRTERRVLCAKLRALARRLTEDWPPIPPTWLARTDERLLVTLAGRRVLLRGTVDLALGVPEPGRASTCLVALRTGTRRETHRIALHQLALLDTIRGETPFRLATYYATSGELDAEDVTDDLLANAVERIAERVIRTLASAPSAPPVLAPPAFVSAAVAA